MISLMRAIDVTIDSLPATVPLDQLYVMTGGQNGEPARLRHHRIPNLLANVSASLEVAGEDYETLPALCYWALPDGLAVGLGDIVIDRASTTAVDFTRHGKIVGSDLWSWREIADDWPNLTLSGARLVKKSVKRFEKRLERFVSPPALFAALDARIPDLALPGVLAIVAVTDAALPSLPHDGLEMSLYKDHSGESLVFRYEIISLV